MRNTTDSPDCLAFEPSLWDSTLVRVRLNAGEHIQNILRQDKEQLDHMEQLVANDPIGLQIPTDVTD